jgi:MFS family permease
MGHRREPVYFAGNHFRRRLITFGLFFHPLASAFHWSYTRIAALITVECLMIAVASPIVGWVLERIEARFAISFGAAVATVAYLIAGGAHSFVSMLLAYGLLGISLGCSTFVPLPIVVAQWFAENRGLAMGIVISGAPFGGLVMNPRNPALMGLFHSASVSPALHQRRC